MWCRGRCKSVRAMEIVREVLKETKGQTMLYPTSPQSKSMRVSAREKVRDMLSVRVVMRKEKRKRRQTMLHPMSPQSSCMRVSVREKVGDMKRKEIVREVYPTSPHLPPLKAYQHYQHLAKGRSERKVWRNGLGKLVIFGSTL